MNRPTASGVLEPRTTTTLPTTAVTVPGSTNSVTAAGTTSGTAWRILLVENSPRDAETLARGLSRHGHEVTIVPDGNQALRAFADADLVLLDLELPDLDGLEVCRAMRATSEIPIIAVTARGSELDRVLGLQAGADDYLVKPYGFRELMARMDAVMRRSRPRAPITGSITRGGLSINSQTREVSLHGIPVETTRKEFDMLYLLASHPDAVVPRKMLMQRVWGDSWSRRTVDTHVSTLRNKIGADWIITIRGVGFRIGMG
ncbi:response regulator transcription factor (plasmid) [Streptomyces sp. BI20]|uniref:response regulator transcription factor n=1 Tax=Streptomyces sp. BI20 TaxID=3403460 RepID=UPI003C72FE9F